ncbi:hypothetical protein [Sandaracinus amylolyticus]|uniref:Uncharacterized protein n=1 Tax=Sandaracinus amylolyticus TaxID=927083 RepID=A0A0F6YJN9_9BACT|nr:hypothetical protein [Sandaracinus amylolyticus]AKF06316.1 hypothetical protein DB32_003465 [Sandaracinus amylolyticus]
MPLFPIELLLVLRFVKLIAVAALAAGTVGAFVPLALEDRQRFAYAVAGPGFGAVWIAGWAMAFGGGVSLVAPWIVGAATASLLSINVVLWAVGKDGRRSARAGMTACGLLAVCLALMVWKPTF